MLQQTDYCNIYQWDALHCNWRELGCVAIGGKCVATNVRGGVAMDGWKMLQWMVGRCCNGWAEGVAMNGRGGTGKMQQDVAIFHSGWTTVNDATAIYGSYCKSCNKAPCTLHVLCIMDMFYRSPHF